ncbi:hypothetical protein OAS39_10720 [Pirellulales bacterium]|nr:hypothetical protein [Pirellulales bacterium]
MPKPGQFCLVAHNAVANQDLEPYGQGHETRLAGIAAAGTGGE